MYSNYADNNTLNRGRKKVFAAKQKLELLLPNGKNDGVLEEGDLVYVAQKIKKGNKSAIRFRVMKFAESPKEATIYSAEEKYFQPYFEKQANSDGDTPQDAKPQKPNYRVPMITSLAGGVLGYLLAQRFGKNKLVYGLIGVGVGLGTGIFLIKNSKKNDK